MVAKDVVPYGSWKSPISADLIVAGDVMLGQVQLDGEHTYWIEGRPTEGGRHVVVRRGPSGQIEDLTPPSFNARTRVHEYGGGAYAVDRGAVYFSNFADNRLYRQSPRRDPEPITVGSERRFADLEVDRSRDRLICVCEDHTDPSKEAVNCLVAVDVEGRSEPKVLVSGCDFYAAPRISADGARLAWLSWNHPNMPWDGCELWVGDLAADGSISGSQQVAGGQNVSIFQPRWSPDGVLYYVSDETGWWNLRRWNGVSQERMTDLEAEFGVPHWVFGQSTYAFIDDTRIICVFAQNGIDHLAYLDTETKELQPIDVPYGEIEYVQATARYAVFIAGSPTLPQTVVKLDAASNRIEVLKESSDISIDEGYISVPEPLDFPTEHGQIAHAFLYPPANRDFAGPPGELPPLIVHSHGGPTGASTSTFRLTTQFWTSRGFALLDVNYGGSSGYGRAYRERLDGQWGAVDVDDCVNGARYLVEQGRVDPDRLVIVGGSAGGYTTLCALTMRDTFKGGASHFGLADLEPFVTDTHKFESRYLIRLVGPYPERKDLYRERSPIHYADRLSVPVILFQGLDDKVVLPNQAEIMVKAMREKGLPFAYVAFAGEGHGFRRSENIKAALEGELYFYSRIFGFPLPDQVRPVRIENLPEPAASGASRG